MHAIHAILVKLEDMIGEPYDGTNEELKEIARSEALERLNEFGDGDVWDWYANDAGRWKERYPDNVILGVSDKDKFLSELDDFKNVPLSAAMQTLKFLYIDKPAWRTREQIETDGVTEIHNDNNDPKGKMFSGNVLPDMVINETTVNKLWDEDSFSMTTWRLAKIFKLVDGQYCFDSQFYSIPDDSSKISKETYKDCIDHPENYALVLYDLHN
jgi:hypothetical protein